MQKKNTELDPTEIYNKDETTADMQEHGGEPEAIPVEGSTLNQFAEDGLRAAEASRKLKRKIVVGIVSMLFFAVIALPLIALLDGSADKDPEPYIPSKPGTVIFYEPDYDRLIDIRKDPDYLELDRNIYLQRNEVKILLEPSRLSAYPAVEVLARLVQSLVDGDADAYNELFSERYIADPDMQKLEEPFTMQRVYNILITEIEIKDAEDGKYTEYYYKLEYMINRNDGTYRVDIGHDSSRPQYFMLTDREDGKLLIDRLVYLKS